MAPKMKAQMVLGAFLYPTGHHIAGWRLPEAQADAGVNFPHFAELARTAERGKFDMLFLADSNCMGAADPRTLHQIATRYVSQFEPLTLLSALAAVTERIGLVATTTTTYSTPYRVARQFASLDLLSGGRAAWNVVTSAEPIEAGNFGLDAHVAFDERYDRAAEFVEIVQGLWRSWEDDAFIRDKDSGEFFDPAKLHTLNHKGRHFSVRGPLNVARSPQGEPVIVQAGSSDRGRDLAASIGELIFTAQDNLADSRKFYNDLKSRVAAHGRDPDRVKILPGVPVYVGRSDAEAEDKFHQLQSLVPHDLIVQNLTNSLGIDVSKLDLDGPVPLDLPDTNASKSRRAFIVELVKREKLTLRQLYMNLASARGHLIIKGGPKRVADELESWFVERGADGFNIMSPYFPGGLDLFVDLVVPELQARGLHRTEYSGRTLRDHLGLQRPVSGAALRPGMAVAES